MKELKKSLSEINSFWFEIHEEMEDMFTRTLAKRTNNAKFEIRKLFTSVHNAFKSYCRDRDYEEEDEKLLRMTLKTNVAEARKLLEGPIRQAIIRCENDF